MKINGDIIAGLEEVDEEPYFSKRGCDNCNNGLGNNVTDCRAHVQSTETGWDYYDVQLCGACLCAYHNGDELDDECQNLYEI
jgi:hypothetical protein